MLNIDKSGKKDVQKQEKILKPNIPKYVEPKKTVTFDQFFNFDWDLNVCNGFGCTHVLFGILNMFELLLHNSYWGLRPDWSPGFRLHKC